jgi:hypothetical protein
MDCMVVRDMVVRDLDGRESELRPSRAFSDSKSCPEDKDSVCVADGKFSSLKVWAPVNASGLSSWRFGGLPQLAVMTTTYSTSKAVIHTGKPQE